MTSTNPSEFFFSENSPYWECRVLSCGREDIKTDKDLSELSHYSPTPQNNAWSYLETFRRETVNLDEMVY